MSLELPDICETCPLPELLSRYPDMSEDDKALRLSMLNAMARQINCNTKLKRVQQVPDALPAWNATDPDGISSLCPAVRAHYEAHRELTE